MQIGLAATMSAHAAGSEHHRACYFRGEPLGAGARSGVAARRRRIRREHRHRGKFAAVFAFTFAIVQPVLGRRPICSARRG